MPANTDTPFWLSKTLEELTPREWDSLCDGCGLCCLNKIEYEDIQQIVYTNVACQLLDHETCQCTNYKNRKSIVPDCIQLDANKIRTMSFMPETCAYRLVAERKPLYPWHPLVSKNKESVHTAGISVRGRVISEDDCKNLEDHVVDWVKPVATIKKKKTKSSKRKTSFDNI
jgi:uncharacterized cysteine cluster protein YcgN (CxxCxxCC family)